MAGLHDAATLGDLVLGALRRFPHRVAFRQDDRELTYGAVTDLLGRWAQLFRRARPAARPGRRRAVAQPARGLPRPDRTDPGRRPLHRAAPARARSTTTSTRATRPSCASCSSIPLFARAGRPSCSRSVPALEAVFTFGPSDVGEDIRARRGRGAAAPRRAARIDPDDVAWLLYTGGTTGVPKAAMLPDRGRGADGHQRPDGLGPAERASATWPARRSRHAAGMLITPTLLAGGTVVLQRRLRPGGLARGGRLRARSPSSLLVPTMIYAAARPPVARRAPTSRASRR